MLLIAWKVAQREGSIMGLLGGNGQQRDEAKKAFAEIASTLIDATSARAKKRPSAMKMEMARAALNRQIGKY